MGKPKAQQKQQVLVGVVAGSHAAHASLLWLAYYLYPWSLNPKMRYEFLFWPEIGTSPQELARNNLCQRCLDSDAEVLLMIDDDMIVDGTVLDLLTTPDYDIVAPLQYMYLPENHEKKRAVPSTVPCAFNFDRDAPEGQQIRPVLPTPGQMITDVEAVGSGCMAIKRKVLEDPRMQIEPGLDPPAFFQNQYLANGIRIRGLDIDFCKRATELGYRIRTNWTVQVGHYKKCNLNGVDLYAKMSWHEGYEKGKRDGLETVPVERVEARPNERADRGDGADGDKDDALGRLWMGQPDRATRRRAAREARRAEKRARRQRRRGRDEGDREAEAPQGDPETAEHEVAELRTV